MSSIPNSKMKHAHASHEEQGGQENKPAKKAKPAKQDSIADRARELAEDAVDAVKDRPKTAAAVGAAIVAGAAAIVGGPALARKLKGEEDKPAAKKAKKKD